MPEYFALLLILIVVVSLSPFFIYWIMFVRRFNSIEKGMTYDQVVKIMGKPKEEHRVGEVTTCLWRIHPLRSVFVTRTAVFKNGVVESLTT